MSEQEHEVLDNDEVGEPPESAVPDTVLVGTEDAALVEGIASRTVRKRIATGELHGTKINGAWFVELPREKVIAAGIPIPDTDAEFDSDRPIVAGITRSARTGGGTGRMPEPVDMGPMAELIADLTRKSIDAASTAAMWQERARNLEEQSRSATLALESGQEDHQRKVDELQSAIELARQEAAAEARKQVEDEWRSKSWWQRLKRE